MFPAKNSKAAARDAAALFAQGLQAHQQGNIAAARIAYERVLSLVPRHADALHLSGVVAHQLGEHARGVELIQKAIRENNRVAYYHNNLGECWRALQEPEKAISCYRRALQIDPKLADAHANLGTVLKTQGRFEDAVKKYQRSLELRPKDPRNLANLGAAYCELGRYPEAIDCCRQSVQAAPQLFEGWATLGIALCRSGRYQEALDPLRRALALKPQETNALNQLGIALHRVGQSREGIDVLQSAARIRPDEAGTYLNLGNAWRDLRQFEQAERCYARALELEPDSSNTWNSFGVIAEEQGLLLRAAERLQRSLELDPRNADAWTNLAGVWRRMADPAKSLECFKKALELGSVGHAAGSSIIYMLQFGVEAASEEICVQARKWGEAVMAASEPARAKQTPRRPVARRRLRIGYVSPDFRRHPIAYFMHGLLAQHDRAKFEVFCYSVGRVEDDRTSILKGLVEHWVPALGTSDDELSERVRSDDIDLLIDLTGHTVNHRLRVFSQKPAFRQATYLGFPGTTGLPAVDFRITDRWADPPEESVGHYVEQLVHLDRCAWCYEPPANVEPIASSPASRGEGITFGCFNNYAKVSDDVLDAWAAVLREAGTARLMLKWKPFNEPEFLQVTRQRLVRHGIDPARVALEQRSERMEQHLARYNEIDIALDTYPYHGTTTTCDALWMGVPVITWRGDRHSSRVGASLLTAVGLEDLIAANRDEYVRKAVELADNPGRIAELKQTLRGRMQKSPLMDAVGFARSFEAAIERMVR